MWCLWQVFCSQTSGFVCVWRHGPWPQRSQLFPSKERESGLQVMWCCFAFWVSWCQLLFSHPADARPWADNQRCGASKRSGDRCTGRRQLQFLCTTKYCSCRASRTSLRITLFVAPRFNSPGHDDISSIWCLATLSILVLIVLIATVLNATHIPSCWSVLNNFDTFLILYAFWVRGHDGFYICNLCTLTWIWQCFCINAPHWLVFVRSGGIQILLSVWAASVVCRALWKILKVVSGITVQLLSHNFMHNMWQPRGTPDASRLPLDIQGAFDTGKGISTGLVLWPADLRWLLVAGCGGMWRVFFTEEHGADPFAGSEPIWAITGYIRLPRSPFPLWTLLRQWWCHVWTSWWVEFALDIICEYLWYLCGNYQVAGIEDSQSKQGTVLADATETGTSPVISHHFSRMLLLKGWRGSRACSPRERETRSMMCTVGEVYLGRGFAWSAGKWIASSAGKWIAWNAERWHVQTHKRYIAL